MIYGIGCDLEQVARIEKAAKRESFLRRVYSESELERFGSMRLPFESMAGAWAAKEAFGKALGTGVRSFELSDITIAHDELGAPRYELSGGALEAAKGLMLHLSISHSGGLAQAFCVAEREDT